MGADLFPGHPREDRPNRLSGQSAAAHPQPLVLPPLSLFLICFSPGLSLSLSSSVPFPLPSLSLFYSSLHPLFSLFSILFTFILFPIYSVRFRFRVYSQENIIRVYDCERAGESGQVSSENREQLYLYLLGSVLRSLAPIILLPRYIAHLELSAVHLECLIDPLDLPPFTVCGPYWQNFLRIGDTTQKKDSCSGPLLYHRGQHFPEDYSIAGRR